MVGLKKERETSARVLASTTVYIHSLGNLSVCLSVSPSTMKGRLVNTLKINPKEAPCFAEMSVAHTTHHKNQNICVRILPFSLTKKVHGRIKSKTETPTEMNGSLNPPSYMCHKNINSITGL